MISKTFSSPNMDNWKLAAVFSIIQQSSWLLSFYLYFQVLAVSAGSARVCMLQWERVMSKSTEEEKQYMKNRLWFSSVTVLPMMIWIWWHRIQNRNFRTQIRIFKNIKSYSLVKKDQKSDICQMLVPSRKKQRTTNLGTESLCNPGSVSPEALSREQMWTFPGPLHRFYFHYISTICVSLILRTSSALPQ